MSATLSVGLARKEAGSQARNDKAIWIADVLDSSEVDVKAWFDLSDLSEITMDSLKQAVEEAAMLITILDPSTFDSEWVRAENEWARDAGLDILPFYDADRYRWDEISHWRTNFPHVFKYQASHSDWLPIGDHGGSCNEDLPRASHHKSIGSHH